MIIHRSALRAAHIVTGNDIDRTRFWTGHTFCLPDGTVEATDGKIAARVTSRQIEHDAGFPIVHGLPELADTPSATIAIGAEQINRLVKGTAKHDTIPVLQRVRVGETADGAAYAAATDLSAGTVVALANGAERPTRPALDRVFEQAQAGPRITLCIAGEMLERLAKLAREIHFDHKKGLHAVRLEIPTVLEEAPDGTKQPAITQSIHFTITGHTLQLRGVFMPCRD